MSQFVAQMVKHMAINVNYKLKSTVLIGWKRLVLIISKNLYLGSGYLKFGRFFKSLELSF